MLLTSNRKLLTFILIVILSVLQGYWMQNVLHIPVSTGITDIILSGASLFCVIIALEWIFRNSGANLFNIYVSLVVSAVAALLWINLSEWTLLYYFKDLDHYNTYWREWKYFKVVIAWLLITFHLVVLLISQMNKKNQAYFEQVRSIEQMTNEAELFKLRQQLHPHFLFNSLNAINALVSLDTKKARDMIVLLSDYLRNNIKKEDKVLIPFDDEVKDLMAYLSIEQIRFGNRLSIITNFDISENDIGIPPFLLQPLLENAIKYGLYGTIGQIEISLNALIKKDHLYFTIKNPYDEEVTMNKGTGFGITGIQRRLYLLFNRNDLLHIKKSVPANDLGMKTFQVTIKLPIQKI